MAGIHDAGPRDVRPALPPGAVSIATYLIHPVLNHGPCKLFLRTPPDRGNPGEGPGTPGTSAAKGHSQAHE